MGDKKFVRGVITGVIISVMLGAIASWSRIFYYSVNGSSQLTAQKKLAEIEEYLNRYSVFDVDMEKLEESMYEGFVRGVGDRYTSYMSKESIASFNEEMSGEYAGIGIYVTGDAPDGMILITAPIKGSPGEKAGLQPGDRIIKVNGEEVSAETVDEAIAMMKGPANTTVELSIFRELEMRTFDVDVVRANISVPTVDFKMLENNIGYIEITAFEEPTYDQFMKAYTALNDAGMQGMIIDVRNNLGGYLHTVVKIADELLPEATIVYTEDKDGNREYSHSNDKSFGKPLALLVNRNSASASEILAGAIQDNGIGVLIGERTFGKGLVQQVFELSDKSAVKITVQKYYTPSGVCIQDVGIEPDYIVDLPEELVYRMSIEEEDDTQLQMAMSVLSDKIDSM